MSKDSSTSGSNSVPVELENNLGGLLSVARELDAADSLAFMRNAFALPPKDPEQPEKGEQHYFCGHSLGLMPKSAPDYLNELVTQWSQLAVEGHFEGPAPFMPYHEFVTEGLANMVGAKPTEVVAMNSLTANLHFMMASFYRPSGKRRKIVIEASAFPSDRYAVRAQLAHHGLDPDEHLIQVPARTADGLFDQAFFDDLLETSADEIALVMLPGVQYLTGEVLNMRELTQQVQAKGIPIGFDLAHAVGNIPLKLHEWGPDFAVWCHYKYMNSGPGAVAGCFVHQRHVENPNVPRLAGWWGHNKSTRFEMPDQFDPMPTAEGWQVSNPPVFAIAPLRAALAEFAQAGGIEPLREKAYALTSYFRELIADMTPELLQVVTPEEKARSGSQLSLVVSQAAFKQGQPGEAGRALMAKLSAVGIVADWREPNVIRVGFIPSYTRFEDVLVLAQTLRAALAPAAAGACAATT